ncbi:hypothetical protein ACFSGI_09030 [Paenibacillus nicotianae]|uniref:Fur-regulated basic protein B n=1 Tax=Paenibacillus nicotianae TaxID=1526551 RepID=A0ABW4UVD1_9BACL
MNKETQNILLELNATKKRLLETQLILLQYEEKEILSHNIEDVKEGEDAEHQ